MFHSPKNQIVNLSPYSSCVTEIKLLVGHDVKKDRSLLGH